MVYSEDVWIRCLKSMNDGDISSEFNSVHCQMFSFPVLIPAFITIIFLVESPFIYSLAPSQVPADQHSKECQSRRTHDQPLDSVKDSVLCIHRKLENTGIMIQVEGSFAKTAYLVAACLVGIRVWGRHPERTVKKLVVGYCLQSQNLSNGKVETGSCLQFPGRPA